MIPPRVGPHGGKKTQPHFASVKSNKAVDTRTTQIMAFIAASFEWPPQRSRKKVEVAFAFLAPCRVLTESNVRYRRLPWTTFADDREDQRRRARHRRGAQRKRRQRR